jgi:pseudouridine-5'-monophosphatase
MMIQLARPVTHVIFDMDGVLLDTERFYTEATQRIVSRYGKRFDWSIKSNMMGRSPIEAIRYLVDVLQLPVSAETYLKEREKILRELALGSAPMPGAVDLVRSLHAARIPLAVASSTERPLFELKTARHQKWFKLFDAIVLGDDKRIKSSKPAPDIFLLAASDLGAMPEHCLVFEDSPAGVAAGKAAGMQVVAVPFPGMDHSRLKEADALIESLAHLTLRDLGFTDS